MENLAYASIMFPTEHSQTNGILLASSIREFGGSMSPLPIWFYVPDIGMSIDSEVERELDRLDVEIMTFDTGNLDIGFPFLGHAYAASLAEERAENEQKNVAWLAPNNIVLKEPIDMILDDGILLGYRPVHHKLIGSDYEKPKDEFWSAIFEYCKISDEKVFPMRTHVDSEKIRPYFNAGFLIVKPIAKILRTWYSLYSKGYDNDLFSRFYDLDEIYLIFIHQAILSGVILSLTKKSELKELHSLYNYPIHLHNEDVTDQKPELIDNCFTIRYEGFYTDSNWPDLLKASEKLKEWFSQKISLVYKVE